jgi:hypothetical protein
MRGGQTTKEQDAEPNRWDHPRLTVLATFLKTFVFDYQYEDFVEATERGDVILINRSCNLTEMLVLFYEF